MATSVTKKLAQFASKLTLEDIPEEVKIHAKKCILDTICCGLFGSIRPEGKTVIATLKELSGSNGQASVWGTDYKTDCSSAALANGIMVESFTMDDLHNRSIVHPGSVTVPTALAIVEWLGNVSGKELLTAIITGYETVIRVGLGVSRSARVRGHHPVGICGPFGAAAATGKLLGLNEEQMLSALGNAGSLGSGLMSAQFGFMTQRLHAGKANQSGILAAFLGRNGFAGTTNVLEAEYGGFCRTYADEWNLDKIIEGLGDIFETKYVGLRPYACAGSVCTSVDAIKTLKERYNIQAEKVKEVIITCNESIALHCGWKYKPDTIITAQMNIPYGVVVSLLEGNASVEQYTEEKISDPRVLAEIEKVRVVHDPDLDAKGETHAYYVHAEIKTKDGKSRTAEVYWAKGTPANPLSEKELATKCHSLADGIIGSGKVDSLIELVLNIEDVKEVSKWFEIL